MTRDQPVRHRDLAGQRGQRPVVPVGGPAAGALLLGRLIRGAPARSGTAGTRFHDSTRPDPAETAELARGRRPPNQAKRRPQPRTRRLAPRRSSRYGCGYRIVPGSRISTNSAANSAPTRPTESIALRDSRHGTRHLAAVGHSLTASCIHTASDVFVMLKAGWPTRHLHPCRVTCGHPDSGSTGHKADERAAEPGLTVAAGRTSIRSRRPARVAVRTLGSSAVLTALFRIGLELFCSVYFSSAIISGSRLYGTLGVVFTLMTWFIAIGAVIVPGAVAGAPRDQRKRPPRGHRDRII